MWGMDWDLSPGLFPSLSLHWDSLKIREISFLGRGMGWGSSIPIQEWSRGHQNKLWCHRSVLENSRINSGVTQVS